MTERSSTARAEEVEVGRAVRDARALLASRDAIGFGVTAALAGCCVGAAATAVLGEAATLGSLGAAWAGSLALGVGSGLWRWRASRIDCAWAASRLDSLGGGEACFATWEELRSTGASPAFRALVARRGLTQVASGLGRLRAERMRWPRQAGSLALAALLVSTLAVGQVWRADVGRDEHARARRAVDAARAEVRAVAFAGGGDLAAHLDALQADPLDREALAAAIEALTARRAALERQAAGRGEAEATGDGSVEAIEGRVGADASPQAAPVDLEADGGAQSARGEASANPPRGGAGEAHPGDAARPDERARSGDRIRSGDDGGAEAAALARALGRLEALWADAGGAAIAATGYPTRPRGARVSERPIGAVDDAASEPSVVGPGEAAAGSPSAGPEGARAALPAPLRAAVTAYFDLERTER